MTKRALSMTCPSFPTPTTTTTAAHSTSRRSTSRQRGTIHTLLTRPSPFGNESGSLPVGEFPPNVESNGDDGRSLAMLKDAKILVVGAGGLGCEILKDLGMLEGVVREVCVMDLDTIDVTNLNRQFLFRQKDIGQSKAVVAANFINRRCPWMNVVPYNGKIQDKDADFYRQFKVVISGLDNIEARRWLNGMMSSLVEFDEDGDPIPETIIPLIDGGTEGFSGQSRLILPRITSCFECSLDTFAPRRQCRCVRLPKLHVFRSIVLRMRLFCNGRRNSRIRNWMPILRPICSGCMNVHWSERTNLGLKA
eukprot:CCRYP_020932-RA/>CCRYP_020932-RA protein AED:0.28 eAED:0.28 QI:105/1/1/1/1/1/2/642/306